MIPILYAANETDFTHNGIGFLAEAVSCIVSEERNGTYELELKYPILGRLYSYIETECIIKAKANDTSTLQLFRIYKHSKPFNGIVTYSGEHISYALSRLPIESVSVEGVGASAALNEVLSASIIEHNFTGQSDISTPNSTSLSFVSVRAALGGVDGSLLDTYGGEYEFDNFNIKLHKQRGKDTGITIAYGKNLTDLKQEKNISSVYTAVFPYAKYTPQGSTEQTVVLPEKIIYSPNADKYAQKLVCIKDFSSEFESGTTPTVEALRSKATSWVNNSEFDTPSVNITVAFKHLWKSPEYAKYAPLERVGLCDTLTVYYEKLGVSAKAKVIKTRYNTLKEDYESLELGNAKANFADTFNSSNAEITNTKAEIKKQSQTVNIKMAEAIAAATAAITGQSGGYVVLNPPNNPQEILIMDKPNIETATNVWRWNSEGLGHSSKGYNGPYKTAITAAGSIVADFITSGQINASLITTGELNADLIKAGIIKDASGKSSWNLETGAFVSKNATIEGSITARGSDKYLRMVSGTLRGGVIENGAEKAGGYITFGAGQAGGTHSDTTALFIVGQPKIVLKGEVFTENEYNQPGNYATLSGTYMVGNAYMQFENGMLVGTGHPKQ